MKRVAVFGAAHGIGRATVEKLLVDGNFVAGVDIDSLYLEGMDYAHFICDLSDYDAVSGVLRRLVELNIEYVVYSAAEQQIFSSHDPDMSRLQRMFAVNVFSAWQAIAGLQKQSSRPLKSVVLVSSVHALATSRHIAGYAMTKAALASLVRSLAIDFSREGTRVNGVLPGAVKTRMLTQHLDEDAITQYSKRQLIDRLAEPEEIAKSILFLLSDDASYMTGANIVVDGGILPLLATES